MRCALRGDAGQCLFGVVGSAGRAQAIHEQPVGLQQRPRPTLPFQPLNPVPGAFACTVGVIGHQRTNLGLVAELGGDLTEPAIRESMVTATPWRNRQPQPRALVVHVCAQPGKAAGVRDVRALVEAFSRGNAITTHRHDARTDDVAQTAEGRK